MVPSTENDRPVAAQKYAILKHQPERASEDNLFHVASSLREVCRSVGVIHGNNLLDDNGSLIQFIRYKVGGGPDDFDAPVKGLVIRPGADKGRKKRMVDVDNARREVTDKARTENSHVFRQHQTLRIVAAGHFEQRRLVCIAFDTHVTDLM